MPRTRCVLADQLRDAGEGSALAEAGCPELELRPPTSSNPDGVYLHGGGIARKLWRGCVDAGLDAAVLAHFVSQGDTREEAIALVRVLSKWLAWKNVPREWAPPPTWALTQAPDPVRGLF
jgi:hypothetical protein